MVWHTVLFEIPWRDEIIDVELRLVLTRLVDFSCFLMRVDVVVGRMFLRSRSSYSLLLSHTASQI